MASPIYLLWTRQIILDATPERAWPYLIDFTAWQNYPIAEHISGSRGAEGEVVQLKKDETGFSFPPYFARTCILDPPHRVVWKTYPTEGPEAQSFMGIVDFSMQAVGDGARLSLQLFYEMNPAEDVADVRAFREDYYRNTSEMFDAVLPRLQRLVRGESAEERTELQSR
jgi:hypothetical protein